MPLPTSLPLSLPLIGFPSSCLLVLLLSTVLYLPILLNPSASSIPFPINILPSHPSSCPSADLFLLFSFLHPSHSSLLSSFSTPFLLLFTASLLRTPFLILAPLSFHPPLSASLPGSPGLPQLGEHPQRVDGQVSAGVQSHHGQRPVRVAVTGHQVSQLGARGHKLVHRRHPARRRQVTARALTVGGGQIRSGQIRVGQYRIGQATIGEARVGQARSDQVRQ